MNSVGWPHGCMVCHRRGRIRPPWQPITTRGGLARWVCSDACRAQWESAQVCRVCGLPAERGHWGWCRAHYMADWRWRRFGHQPRPWYTHCQACGKPRGRRFYAGRCGACYARQQRAKQREAAA